MTTSMTLNALILTHTFARVLALALEFACKRTPTIAHTIALALAGLERGGWNKHHEPRRVGRNAREVSDAQAHRDVVVGIVDGEA